MGAGVVIRGGSSGPASSEIWFWRVGPDWTVGEGVYAGGGSFEGTVKAFMPGRSGRLVAGEGLVRGLGLLRLTASSLSANGLPISPGPLNVGVVGVLRSE